MPHLPELSCTGCHACAVICPKQCISMERDQEFFLYPRILTSECIECNLCSRCCPVLDPQETKEEEKIPLAYAAKHKDLNIRMGSSSGGVFTALAEFVISEKKGVVFGACFDWDFQVHQQYTESLSGLAPFRRSKYVQSTIGNAFVEAKTFLEQDRMVLFTGTPFKLVDFMIF